MILRQVHGGRIVDASSGDGAPPAADGVFRVGRDAPAVVPAVRTADCVAVLVADRRARAVAALHAGWRGAAAGIVARAVSRFAAEGIDARELVVAMGPAILGCCYGVGEEVVTALAGACGAESGFVERTSGRISVDLHAALRAQWQASGVEAESIHEAPWCTRCRTDLFFSHRGEGAIAGRLMAVIGPAAGP
jgi:YfiH family protein